MCDASSVEPQNGTVVHSRAPCSAPLTGMKMSDRSSAEQRPNTESKSSTVHQDLKQLSLTLNVDSENAR